MSRLHELTTAELIGLAATLKADGDNLAMPIQERAAALTANARCWQEIDRRAEAIRSAENRHAAPRVQPGDRIGDLTATAEDIARARQLTDQDAELEDLAS